MLFRGTDSLLSVTKLLINNTKMAFFLSNYKSYPYITSNPMQIRRKAREREEETERE